MTPRFLPPAERVSGRSRGTPQAAATVVNAPAGSPNADRNRRARESGRHSMAGSFRCFHRSPAITSQSCTYFDRFLDVYTIAREPVGHPGRTVGVVEGAPWSAGAIDFRAVRERLGEDDGVAGRS